MGWVTALIFLVEERPNPSSDYFVLPALRAMGAEVRRCGFSEVPTRSELDGAVVVLVRYVPAPWRRWIESGRSRIRQLVFFMDDDLLDIAASRGLPWRYRWKLARLAAWQQGWLRRQQASLWVSTDYLARKYREWNPVVVHPAPLAGIEEGRMTARGCRVFYHGSASHGAEVRWLRPVLEEVLKRDESVSFEIIGGREVHRLYCGLPRVTVVHPMNWPAYQAFLKAGSRDIGLAPQVDSPFNRARSYTKFFDITQSGAVGIYSPGSATADVVAHDKEGLVIELEPRRWADAILRLAADEPLRRVLLENARVKVDALADVASREALDNPLARGAKRRGDS